MMMTGGWRVTALVVAAFLVLTRGQDQPQTTDTQASSAPLDVTELDTSELGSEGEETTAVEYTDPSGTPEGTQGDSDNPTPSEAASGETTPAAGGNNDKTTQAAPAATTSVGGDDRTTRVPNETTKVTENNHPTTVPDTATTPIADNSTTVPVNQTTPQTTTTHAGETDTTNTITNTTVDGSNTTTTPSTPNTTITGGSGSNNATDTNITMAPTTIPTTAAPSCGKHAHMSDDGCVCDVGWTIDPYILTANATNTTLDSCPCPDFCLSAGGRGRKCPADSTCHQGTCNMMTCNCTNHQVYEPINKKCVGPCEYYGSSLCGMDPAFKCKSSPSEPLGYMCTCMDGYELKEGSCQDIDECAAAVGAGEAGKERPCKENEKCINLPGGKACPCLPGYLRNATDFCINVNECLNPKLHDCDQVCVDGSPPVNYTCTCHKGFTWNTTTRRCLIDNSSRACNCSDAERSVCYKGDDGKQKCYPRPGYMKSGDKFVDEKECSNKTKVGAWCWRNGECVEGEGGSSCVCSQGYTNQTNNYGICEEECSSGNCQDSLLKMCNATSCPPPLTCGMDASTMPQCQCRIQCRDVMGSNLTSSVYQGTVLLHPVSFTLNTSLSSSIANSTTMLASRFVTNALGKYFGMENIEVVSVLPQTNTTTTSRRRKKREVASREPLLVTFLVATEQQPNMTPEEVERVLNSGCMKVKGNEELCTLSGGLVVKRNSISVGERDPCADHPCPSSANQECTKKDNAPGRFECSCVTGYHKIQDPGFMGYCQDVDECSEQKDLCEKDHVCINTPGSFVCRFNPGVTEAGAQTMREMAISFGILFFLTLFLTIGLVYLLMKKNKRERELVPMTTTTTNSAYENDSYK